MRRFDLVVVGAGASGSVVAGRASEDPARTVLLLEAGDTPRTPADFPEELLDAVQIPGARPGPGHHWSYPVRLTDDRSYTVFRGRVLGGSTTTNGGYFVRARVEDFAAWSQAGNPIWAYEKVLPFLRTLENDLDYGNTDIHGGSGPVPVRRPDMTDPVTSVFAEAADELGFPAEPDKNDQQEPGFGPLPLNIVNGVRFNTGLTYVAPALKRPNFALLGGCTVQRIRLRGTRAVGLDIHIAGQDSTVHADTVVLSAGAFETPRLLMRSGIGPGDELRRLGVPVVCDLSGVGRQFSDHPQIVLEWMPSIPLAPTHSWVTAGLNFRSTDGPRSGDLQILPSNVPMGILTGHPSPATEHALPLLVSVLSPAPTGSLRYVSADPQAPPDIRYGYLSTGEDRKRLREATRTALDLVSTQAFMAITAGPPPDLDRRTARDDRALDRWIRERLGTALHASGTARMGPADNPEAVVDQDGRVHGISGLRIADTSILPAAPLRGPAATGVLIGEIIAHSLQADWRS